MLGQVNVPCTAREPDLASVTISRQGTSYVLLIVTTLPVGKRRRIISPTATGDSKKHIYETSVATEDEMTVIRQVTEIADLITDNRFSRSGSCILEQERPIISRVDTRDRIQVNLVTFSLGGKQCEMHIPYLKAWTRAHCFGDTLTLRNSAHCFNRRPCTSVGPISWEIR